MSVTTEVNGDFKLPTDDIRQENVRNAFGGEPMPRANRHIKHITRLEAVQCAIEENLVKLEKNDPEKKVGLVTFNQSVNVIGDGKMDLVKLNDIDDKESIKRVAERTADFQKIENNKKVLSQKLLNLEEGGATALGPALYYSILVAARQRGSQVILCTDGLANKGIGSLENTNGEETATANKFYNDMADVAAQQGVSVSVITIEGTNCRLGVLGEIASKTGGTVNTVNPLKIKEEFSTILDEQIIATNVKASLILPKAMFIRDHENLNNRQSSITKEIGNVTKETEITFEFALREDAELDLKLIKELPFQLKITYDGHDGKYMRVLTQLKKITAEKRVAEEHSDRSVMAAHAIQTTTSLFKKNMIPPNSSIMGRFSSYIKKLNPIKEDNFSKEIYEGVETDLSNFAQNRSYLAEPSSAASSLNQFEQLSDADASKGYRYGKMRSKDMKK
jgi:hypothetical protein